MSVIKEAFSVNARLTIPQAGANALSVEVQIDDAAIRAQEPAFDGMESVFVLVPRETATGVEWDRQPLEYRKTENAHDLHAKAFTQVDATAVAKYGVAVGLASNGNTIEVWGQNDGDNYKAKVLQQKPVPRPRPIEQRFESLSKMLAAQGSRVMDSLDDEGLVTFAKAQADLRDALAATEATSDKGLVRLAACAATLLDLIESKLWTPIDAKLRTDLGRYEQTLHSLRSLVKNSL